MNSIESKFCATHGTYTGTRCPNHPTPYTAHTIANADPYTLDVYRRKLALGYTTTAALNAANLYNATGQII